MRKKRSDYKRVSKKCLICNMDFTAAFNKIKKGEGKYCSRKCRDIGKSERIKRICLTCGKEFKTVPYRIKIGKGKYCSVKCYGIWESKNKRGEKSGHWKGGKVKRVCEICGVDFMKKPYVIKNGGGRFCSYKCMGIWQSKNRIGEKCPSWKGGINPVVLSIRRSRRYYMWREQVFIRDNFTCQKCKRHGGDFHAHHIKRFSIILSDIKQRYPLLSLTDIAINYPDLWDITNGITLCKSCHKKEHQK